MADSKPKLAKRFVVCICLALIPSAISLLPAAVTAGVVQMRITSRENVEEWPETGEAGPYEVIKGILILDVDPEDPVNARIVDLKLAERNQRGRVEFSTEFELHKPVSAARGNHRLLYFVNNRGNRIGAGHFSHQAGRNWLYDRGWTYLWCGWNADVVESDRKLNIHVPVATEGGETITGRVYAEMINHGNQPVPSMPLTWGGSVAHPAVSLENDHAVLTMRRYRWEEPVEVPRAQWSFARFEDGRTVPDPGHLFVQDGLKPGWLYDLVYQAKDPRLTGLGLAAIRDVVSFFRYEDADEDGAANPLAGVIEHAYGWGHSQSARLLNHFVYQDFNGDEEGRLVFDGILANCAGGGKGQFNSRFAQTTRHGSHHEDNLFPVDFFPFTSVEQVDPVTGERGDNLALVRQSGFMPRMFYINSATDYWTRAASLLHTDVEGKRDMEIDPNVRVYAVAGRAHVDGRIGIIGRALLTAMDQWISRGSEPPDSRVPRIADGTLVDLQAVRKAFPAVPGLQLPDSYYHPYRLDPGPRWRSDGIADFVPPKTGPRYVCLVPQVDEDGNEIAGIRLPEIAVPLATFCGWSLRSPFYSNTLRRNAGRVWPFARTVSERGESGDARMSISERYPTPADYLSRVEAALTELRRLRFLLEEDHDRLLEQAVKQAELIDDLRSIEESAMIDGAQAAAEYCRRLAEADMLWLYGAESGGMANSINAKGYELMMAGKLDVAKEVFELNTLLYPDIGNVWDSLAECCFNLKRYDESKRHYEKALVLDPNNANAASMLQKIETVQH